jgi:hypothetical protein
MVAEPKAHQTGRKRQNLTKTGNDWYVYYRYYTNYRLFKELDSCGFVKLIKD